MTNRDDIPDPENTSDGEAHDRSAEFDPNKTVNHVTSRKTIKFFLDPNSSKPDEPGEIPGRKTIQFRKGKTVDLAELEEPQHDQENKTISIVKGKTVRLDTDEDPTGLILGGLSRDNNRKTLESLRHHKTVELPDQSQTYVPEDEPGNAHDSIELNLTPDQSQPHNTIDDGFSKTDSSSGTVSYSSSDLQKTWGALSNADARTSLRSPTEKNVHADAPILNDRVVIWDIKAIPPGNPDYQIMSFLGEGAMGKVYIAKQISVDRDVALKVQIEKPGLAHGTRQQQINKFLFEAQLTASLDHPNIVGIHDMGRDQSGQVFYCMELVRGTPWENVMGDMSLESNLDVLLKVINGVSYAHSKNTIHRDLKPENIMLGSFGEVLIMDWGLGVNLDDGPPVTMGGTPGFMAPEMARPPESATGKHSDIYVLGAILFFIITKETPHKGDDVWECLDNAERNVIVDVSAMEDKLDQRLMTIARRAMATKPEERYPSADELKRAIEDSQSNRLSVKLARRSNVGLQRAIKKRNYEGFSKSLFGFREALELWPDNEVAEIGLRQAQHAYAECALERNDFELGMSLLDSENEEDAFLLQKLRKGASAANRRKRLVWLAVGSSIILLAALLATTLLNARTERIYAENLQSAVTQEANAKVEAQIARLRAESERRRAERLLAENERERALVAEEYRQRWFNVFDQGNNFRVYADPEKAPINFVEFDSVGTMVLLGDSAGTLRLGNRDSKGVISRFEVLNTSTPDKTSPIVRAQFANRSSRIVALHKDGTLVAWDLKKQKVANKTRLTESSIVDFASQDDGPWIVSADSTGKLRVRDLILGRDVHVIDTNRTLTNVNFSPDRVVASSDSGDLLFVDLETEQLKAVETEATQIDAIRSSTDGNVTILLEQSAEDDGRVQYWRCEEETWKLACEFGVNVKSIEIAPDGKRVFTGDSKGVLTVWSITDDKPNSHRKLISLHDHDDRITQIDMSEDGQRLVSSSLDGSVIFWLKHD